jgi:hypothetical protein
MTLIVGILCKDGVVMASDSAAMFGAEGRPTIGQQYVRKLHKVTENIIFSSTGAVGISQLLTDKGEKCPTPETAMDRIGKEIVQVVGPYLNTAQFQRNIIGEAHSSLCKSMVALPVNKRPYLFSFDYNGAPERSTSELPFISMGSGQPIADPFLALLHRLLWKGAEPTVAEGRLAGVWTILHVSQTNPGGVGGPPQLATLTGSPGKMPTVEVGGEEDIEEHVQKISAVEQALQSEIRGSVDAPSPAIPKP